ncbi:MAG: RNA polymerase sigma factor [Planctomycetota bacterium]
MPNDDRELWEALLRQERFAWERFFRATWRPVVRFAAFKLGGDHGRAEDVAGESFLTFVRDLRHFDPAAGSLGAFLFGILRHRIASEQRRVRRRPVVSGDVDVEPAAPRVASTSVNVMRAMMDLSVMERETLLRHYEQRVRARDLASENGISLEAMHSRLRRAREKLAELLARRAADD